MSKVMQLLLLNHKLHPLLRSTSYQSVRFFKRSVGPTLKKLKRLQLQHPMKENPRNTYLEWNYDAEIYSFAKRLNEDFDDNLLRQSFIARSYVIKEEEDQKKLGIPDEKITRLKDNADMAHKGEIVIRTLVLQYLRYVLPRFPEEGIIAIMEYLTSEDVLSHVSYHIGTSELILCIDYPVEKSTMATVLKALLYALSQSAGIDRTALFVRDIIVTQIAEQNINELWSIEYPITVLNRICRNEGLPDAEPRLIGEAGVNTILACYRVGLYVNKQMIGLGFGESPDIAHEMAARDTLRRLFKTAEHQLSIPFDLVLKPQLDNLVPNVSIEDWCEENVKKREALVSSQNRAK